jgi:hypothetical protein
MSTQPITNNNRPAFCLMRERTYLCVPYDQRLAAKAAGAVFDWNEKAWYIESSVPNREAFAQWLPHFAIRPDPLPETTWCKNVRSEVSPEDWEILKKRVAKKSGHRCEACGGRGDQWPVECHEIWNFNEATGVQKLVGMTALCPACHEVVHVGLAGINGRTKKVLEHMSLVTGKTYQQCVNVATKALHKARMRSRKRWALDLSFLDDLGIVYKQRSAADNSDHQRSSAA